eukprot:378529_1
MSITNALNMYPNPFPFISYPSPDLSPWSKVDLNEENWYETFWSTISTFDRYEKRQIMQVIQIYLKIGKNRTNDIIANTPNWNVDFDFQLILVKNSVFKITQTEISKWNGEQCEWNKF